MLVPFLAGLIFRSWWTVPVLASISIAISLYRVAGWQLAAWEALLSVRLEGWLHLVGVPIVVTSFAFGVGKLVAYLWRRWRRS